PLSGPGSRQDRCGQTLRPLPVLAPRRDITGPLRSGRASRGFELATVAPVQARRWAPRLLVSEAAARSSTSLEQVRRVPAGHPMAGPMLRERRCRRPTPGAGVTAAGGEAAPPRQRHKPGGPARALLEPAAQRT